MVDAAIKAATQNPSSTIEEGNYGGGTGMTCYDWKGGIGTASRTAVVYGTKANGSEVKIGTYIVGVLVQANQGRYWDLVIRGVPLGADQEFPAPPQSPDQPSGVRSRRAHKRSIIVVVVTDAPLMPHQLKRLARRAGLGVGRTGTPTNNDSGEIFIAFSTANQDAADDSQIVTDIQMVPNGSMDPLFTATVDATEEAIINAMIAADTLTGRNGTHTATRILDATNKSLVEMMKKYKRWVQPTGPK